MFKYLGRRLIRAFIVIIGVTLVTFTLLNIIPGDPVAVMLEKRADQETIDRVRNELGLNKPLYEQYFSFIKGLTVGDLGDSYFEKKPVSEMIYEGLSVTLKLGLFTFFLAFIVGIITGTLAAIARGKFLDKIMMFISMLGISAPVFWVAVLLQLLFGLRLRWFPISGMDSTFSFVLPTIALAMRYAASIARLTRTNVLDALSQDYVKTARSKGVREITVIGIHVLKNASIPVITLLGYQLKDILGGSMLIETIFSLPGIGSLTIDAITARDIPVIQGAVVCSAIIFVIVNLCVDLLYGLLDPRIRVKGV